MAKLLPKILTEETNMEKTNFFSNMRHSDTISYKCINEEYVEKSDLENKNVIGCTVQDSTFTEVNFNSSDFDGTILIHCKFINGDWSRTDCCSLTASNTIFDEIDFTWSTMRNCDFKQCTFIGCKFDHIALSGSNFEQCQFKDIHLVQSSTYLNSYVSCTFDNCDINGNFYYNMLMHNTYVKSFFSKKLFAYNYFLLSDGSDLTKLGLNELLQDELRDYLIQNKLLVNLVILQLNQTNDVDISIIQFIVAIGEILRTGLLVREEQLQFIYKFLQFLLKEEMLSAVTLVESLSYLERSLKIFDTQQNAAYNKCKDTFNLIRNEIYQAYQSMGQSISLIYDESAANIERTVKIVYEQEPQIPICSIINEIKTSLGINAPDAIRVKTEIGSFHEWITCYDSVLQCLQLFIAVLGLGYTVISNHKKKAPEKKVENIEADDSSDISSEQMVALLNKALSKQKVNPEFSQAIQIVVKNDIVSTKKFQGYSRSNVRSIDIVTKNS